MNVVSLANGLHGIQGSNERATKRLRITRACDFCRKKKVKCHAAPGAPCTHCVSVGMTCEFSDSGKKRGPPKGYIGALEARIQKIERLLATADQDTTTTTSASASTAPDRDAGHNSPAGRKRRSDHNRTRMMYHRKQPRGASADHVRLMGDTSVLQQLLQHKIPAARIHELGTHDVRYRLFGRQIVQMTSNAASAGENSEEPQSMDPELCLQRHTGVNFWIYSTTGADRHTSDRLLQIYFLNVHPILPVVNKTEFLRQYRDQADTYPSGDLLNAMFGAASRYLVCESRRQRAKGRHVPPDVSFEVSPEWCRQFFQQASSDLTRSTWASSISKVQTMLLLHNTSTHINAKESPAWILNGLAIRLAQSFGLNRCCDEWDISDSEKELRKRVWWALHIADRFQAAALGRPVSIREEDNDVTYPNPHASWKEILDEPDGDDDDATPRFPSATFRPESTEGETEFYQLFIQLINLSEILGRILQGLYTPRAQQYSIMQGSDVIVTRLDHELTQWRFGFPKALAHANFKDFDEHKGYFASSIASILLCYFACLILLHRPFIEKQCLYADDGEERPSYLSFRISTSAATRGLHIADQMTIRDFVMFPYAFNIYPIFQFCLIHIHNSRSPDGRISAPGRTELRKAMAVVERLRSISTASKMLYDVVGLITETLQSDISLQNHNSFRPGNDTGSGAAAARRQSTHSSVVQSHHPYHGTHRPPIANDEESWDTIPDTTLSSSPQTQHMPRLDEQSKSIFDIQSPRPPKKRATAPAAPEIYTLKQFGFDVPGDPKELDRMLRDMASFSRLEALPPALPPSSYNQQYPTASSPTTASSSSSSRHQLPSVRRPLYNNSMPIMPTTNTNTTTASNSIDRSSSSSTSSPTTKTFSAVCYNSNNQSTPYSSASPVTTSPLPYAPDSMANTMFRNDPSNPFASLSSSMDWSEWYEWTQRA